MLGTNGRAKRAFERSPFRDLVVERLDRSSLLNPTLGFVHATAGAESDEFAQLVSPVRLASIARRIASPLMSTQASWSSVNSPLRCSIVLEKFPPWM